MKLLLCRLWNEMREHELIEMNQELNTLSTREKKKNRIHIK